jgi:hypothetical protein
MLQCNFSVHILYGVMNTNRLKIQIQYQEIERQLHRHSHLEQELSDISNKVFPSAYLDSAISTVAQTTLKLSLQAYTFCDFCDSLAVATLLCAYSMFFFVSFSIFIFAVSEYLGFCTIRQDADWIMCFQVWFIISFATFAMMLETATKHLVKNFSELEPVPKIEDSKNRQLEMLAREKKNLVFLMDMADKKQKMIAQAQETQQKIMESYTLLCDGKSMDKDGQEHFKTTSLNIASTSIQLAMNTFEMAADIESRCIPATKKMDDTAAAGGDTPNDSAGDNVFDGGDCAFV